MDSLVGICFVYTNRLCPFRMLVFYFNTGILFIGYLYAAIQVVHNEFIVIVNAVNVHPLIAEIDFVHILPITFWDNYSGRLWSESMVHSVICSAPIWPIKTEHWSKLIAFITVSRAMRPLWICIIFRLRSSSCNRQWQIKILSKPNWFCCIIYTGPEFIKIIFIDSDCFRPSPKPNDRVWGVKWSDADCGSTVDCFTERGMRILVSPNVCVRVIWFVKCKYSITSNCKSCLQMQSSCLDARNMAHLNIDELLSQTNSRSYTRERRATISFSSSMFVLHMAVSVCFHPFIFASVSSAFSLARRTTTNNDK